MRLAVAVAMMVGLFLVKWSLVRGKPAVRPVGTCDRGIVRASLLSRLASVLTTCLGIAFSLASLLGAGGDRSAVIAVFGGLIFAGGSVLMAWTHRWRIRYGPEGLAVRHVFEPGTRYAWEALLDVDVQPLQHEIRLRFAGGDVRVPASSVGALEFLVHLKRRVRHSVLSAEATRYLASL